MIVNKKKSLKQQFFAVSFKKTDFSTFFYFVNQIMEYSIGLLKNK